MAAPQQKRDYYEVLETDRSAGRDQIKQAYRRLALQYHPDRNKDPAAAERFKEIAEAYAVLSDDTKRREYDVMGHAGIHERWTDEELMRGFHFGDFFGGRFDDLSGIFGNFWGGRPFQPAQHRTGADLRYDLDLTLEEAAKGGKREIRISRSETCSDCKGSGAKLGTAPKTCPDCKGTGQKQHVQSGKGVRMTSITTCLRCHGTGHIIEHPCGACRGSGKQQVGHTLNVEIPAGMDDGMIIRLSGQGEPHPAKGPPGDLFIRPHLLPHPTLTRQGDDLYAMSSINLIEAALGTERTVSGLGGDRITIPIPSGTQSGTTINVSGKGMPRLNGDGKGRLCLVVEVRTPTDMTPQQRALLEEYGRLEQERVRSAGAGSRKHTSYTHSHEHS